MFRIQYCQCSKSGLPNVQRLANTLIGHVGQIKVAVNCPKCTYSIMTGLKEQRAINVPKTGRNDLCRSCLVHNQTNVAVAI